MKKIFRNFLLRKNIRISRTKSYRDIKKFLSLISPIETNYELIRVGGKGDGGYLIPNDLEGIDFCFSPGVSTIANFENDLAATGIKCFLADFSVDGPPSKNKLFDFEKKYLGTFNSENTFTLDFWLKSKIGSSNSDLILQMNIEGDEYAILSDIDANLLKKFRIIVLEFHYLDSMLDTLGFEIVRLSFLKILRDFEIVHIHPNNCSYPVSFHDLEIPPVLEVTFLRKDRIKNKKNNKRFPHPLDDKNIKTNSDVKLPKCWYEK